MQKRIFTSIATFGQAGLLLAAGLLAGGWHPAEALENNVKVTGNLVNEPCTLDPASASISLDFKGLVSKYFYRTARTPGQVFHIVLKDCDTSLGKSATVTFIGTESQALPGLLTADSGDSRGLAFGIEMATANGIVPVPLNKPSPVFALSKGTLDLMLQGYVQAEPAAIQNRTLTPGPFTATAIFQIAYP